MRVLIANNGMAATKMCLSLLCEQDRPFLVGLASEEDLQANTAYLSLVDTIEMIPIGGLSEPSVICSAAMRAGCDAVWPGWGHSSENAELAALLESVGITWVGPPSSAMRILGDKVSAMAAAEAAGVPMVAWSGLGGLTSSSEALEECNRIGYPVMLKSSCCGGGRGIRKVVQASEVVNAFDSVSRVTRSDGFVFAMKCAESCMHVELQVISDKFGDVRVLGARDCSVQRRFQKLVEESPPPLLPETDSEKFPGFPSLAASVERLFRSVGYANAGTAEFLFCPKTRKAFFLEVNCRLQVEHVVTEKLFPGLNLPLAMLKIAAGARLRDIEGIPAKSALRGVGGPQHVIATRIVAEVPGSFLPQTGKISSIVYPGEGYFCFSGIGEVRGGSDSQIGHIWVGGNSRGEAALKMANLLKGIRIRGEIDVDTYCKFIAETVLENSHFLQANHDTHWYSKFVSGHSVNVILQPNVAVVAAAMHIAREKFSQMENRFSDEIQRGLQFPTLPDELVEVKFSVAGESGMSYNFQVARTSETDFAIFAPEISSDSFSLWTTLSHRELFSENRVLITIPNFSGSGDSTFLVSVCPTSSKLLVRCGGETWKFLLSESDPGWLEAATSGRVVQWLVGDAVTVEAGKGVVEIECMKMTSIVCARMNGRLRKVVNSGSVFEQGSLLGVIEKEDGGEGENQDQVFENSPIFAIPKNNAEAGTFIGALDGHFYGSPGGKKKFPGHFSDPENILKKFILTELQSEDPGTDRILWRAKLNRSKRAALIEQIMSENINLSDLEILTSNLVLLGRWELRKLIWRAFTILFNETILESALSELLLRDTIGIREKLLVRVEEISRLHEVFTLPHWRKWLRGCELQSIEIIGRDGPLKFRDSNFSSPTVTPTESSQTPPLSIRTTPLSDVMEIESISGRLSRTASSLDPMVIERVYISLVPYLEISSVPPETVDASVESKRESARKVGSVWVGDVPKILAKACEQAGWDVQSFERIGEIAGEAEKHLSINHINTAECGMLAWLVTVLSDGLLRKFVLIANDTTYQQGSFALNEDLVYLRASELSRRLEIPRIFFACNSGARIGLSEEVGKAFKFAPISRIVADSWGVVGGNGGSSTETGSERSEICGGVFLYLSEIDFARLKHQVEAEPVVLDTGETVHRLHAVFGSENELLGCENLAGSAAIAAESSKAYQTVPTITFVSGRTVGIGAYIARLCQRVIQKRESPIILTGYQAINRLVGRDIYRSNEELGGQQVMGANGITHLYVDDDLEGFSAIVRWLQHVPRHKGASLLESLQLYDPIERQLKDHLRNTRSLLTDRECGMFDLNSFWEVQSEWAKSVIVGRARLGGVPVGVIAAETAITESHSLADPADPNSRVIKRQDAGQVWFPDSAFKTAQAIQDFSKEELPIIIIANWRGFSGGRRDMGDGILKFGSFIVDQLAAYEKPVFVYIPPGGELRGGSWVVVDPRINPKHMELFADPTARGGVIQPTGTVEVKFRAHSKVALLQRSLDGNKSSMVDASMVDQAALTFAELHDTPARMKKVKSINGIVPWRDARAFFGKRIIEKLRADS